MMDNAARMKALRRVPFTKEPVRDVPGLFADVT
jgi:hypothetical protein